MPPSLTGQLDSPLHITIHTLGPRFGEAAPGHQGRRKENTGPCFLLKVASVNPVHILTKISKATAGSRGPEVQSYHMSKRKKQVFVNILMISATIITNKHLLNVSW